MSETINRLAPLLFHEEDWPPGLTFETDLLGRARERCREDVKKLLGAMREPTPDMLRCGCGWGMGLSDAEVIVGWRAMIDEALR